MHVHLLRMERFRGRPCEFYRLVTLGPIAKNFDMLVLDAEDRPVSPGETGELCLLGPQVGLGYVGDPARTAAAFMSNPANEQWTQRMYRTGTWFASVPIGARSISLAVRIIRLNIWGYRIELEEIEAALSLLDGVRQCAVVQSAGRRGMKMLVAHVAAGRLTTEDEVREHLATHLPAYMIPQRFAFHIALPKNANGKVDRIALAAATSEGAQ